jgi:hypothetical protein
MWQAFQAGGLASWFSNPYVLLAAAIVAIIVGLVILYIKWKWFHDHVNATGRWIVQHWKLVVGVISTINPPLAFTIFLVVELIKNFRRLVNWAKDAWGWIKKIWNLVPGHQIAGAIASTLFGGGTPGVSRHNPLSLAPEREGGYAQCRRESPRWPATLRSRSAVELAALRITFSSITLSRSTGRR